MLKASLFVLEAITILMLFAALSPILVADAIGRAYRRIDLHVVYGGEITARDRAEYKQAL